MSIHVIITIGYDFDDRFTMEHFPLCQIMILTTSFFLLVTVFPKSDVQFDNFKLKKKQILYFCKDKIVACVDYNQRRRRIKSTL
jgi:hypothetical protein